ncbi:hypothetical protein FACS189490_05630 [Clostridia bacterium]|nr:hypothetical protein FACS189490_05630 [Clostridia bacterium]
MKHSLFALKSIVLFLAVILLIPASFREVYAFSSMKSRVYDDFNRASLGVTAPGNTGAGTEPDDNWLHNPDGYVIYWIQYNADTNLSIVDGALKIEAVGNGWVGFGMTGDVDEKAFPDKDYDSIVVRLKGENGGEEEYLYFNVQGQYDIKWDNARDPDNKPLGKITKEYQDFTISLRNSGMGATKAQRNTLTKGWTDLHINTAGAATVYVDSVKQLQTVEYTEPTAPPSAETVALATEAPATEATATETPSTEATATETPTEEATEAPEPEDEIYPETDRDISTTQLIDDFNRVSLMLDPELEIPPGGEFGYPNTDGVTIYWIQWNDSTSPVLENSALHLNMGTGGWYGTGTDTAFADEYDCLAIRIKGAVGNEETAITLNPDTSIGGKPLSDFVGPDGNKVPAITTEYQTIVIDLAKSGYNRVNSFGEAFEYQYVHFNSTAPADVYIDEIYWLAVDPKGGAAELEPAPAATPEATEQAAPPSLSSTLDPAVQPTFAPTPAPTAKTESGGGKIAVIVILAVVIVAAITAVIVLVTKRKPA